MAKFLLVKAVRISGFTQNVAVNVDKIERISEDDVLVNGEVRTRCTIVLADGKVTVDTKLDTLLDKIKQLGVLV